MGSTIELIDGSTFKVTEDREMLSLRIRECGRLFDVTLADNEDHAGEGATINPDFVKAVFDNDGQPIAVNNYPSPPSSREAD